MHNIKSLLEKVAKNIPNGSYISNIENESFYRNLKTNYQEVIKNINMVNVKSYHSDLIKIIDEGCRIVESINKNLEIISIIVICMTICYGSDGMYTGIQMIHNTLVDYWQSMTPEITEDGLIKRSNIIEYTFKKLETTFKEFIMIDSNYNLIKLIKSNQPIRSGSAYIIKQKLQSSIAIIRNIESYINDKLSNIENISNETVDEASVNLSEIISSIRNVVAYIDFDDNEKESNIENYNTSNEELSIEQIKSICYKLSGNKHYNLLGKCILYCIQEMDTNSINLAKNMYNNPVIKLLIEKVVHENTNKTK